MTEPSEEYKKTGSSLWQRVRGLIKKPEKVKAQEAEDQFIKDVIESAYENRSTYDADNDEEIKEIKSRVPWYMLDNQGKFLQVWNLMYSVLVA